MKPSIERPAQRVLPSFQRFDQYDISIPWSVFPAEPPLQDFSVREGAGVYFADCYAEVNGCGTIDSPFNSAQHAIDQLCPGDTLYFRGGIYETDRPIMILDKERITISSYGSELAIFDGSGYNGDSPNYDTEYGIFTFNRCSGVVLRNMKFRNSHCKGISIFNSNDMEVLHCETENTFACGIAVWDSSPTPEKCNAFRGFRILGNTVRKANTWDMIPIGRSKEGEPPHEAISIAGAAHFEVAYNHVYECDKEGIDVKENSRSGIIHHNSVHHCARQGLYADAWFGTLADVRFENNIVMHNRGAGLAISVEGINSFLTGVSFENNMVVGNWGTGFFISRWGFDLPRENIVVRNNTFLRNGHGGAYGTDTLFWITGGIHFFSSNIRNMIVENNIFSDNDTFEIGFSDSYGCDTDAVRQSLAERNIVIRNNLVNYTDHTAFPVTVGWPGNFSDVLQYAGENCIQAAPLFLDPDRDNYTVTDPNLLSRNIGAVVACRQADG